MLLGKEIPLWDAVGQDNHTIEEGKMSKQAHELIQRLRDEVKWTLDVMGECDHDVGICRCDVVDLLRDADEYLASRKHNKVSDLLAVAQSIDPARLTTSERWWLEELKGFLADMAKRT